MYSSRMLTARRLTVSGGGVYLLMGVCLRGGLPPHDIVERQTPPVKRQTRVKTLPSHNFVCEAVCIM